jgi:hypothetical protein
MIDITSIDPSSYAMSATGLEPGQRDVKVARLARMSLATRVGLG